MHSAFRRVAFGFVLLSVGTSSSPGQTWTQDPNVHPTLINDQPALSRTTFTSADDGRVLLAGAFTHLENGQQAASGLAYLHGDGTIDRSFNATQTGLVASAIPLQNGGVLGVTLVGGGWEIEPDSVLFRLLPNGSPDASYQPITIQGTTRLTRLPDGRIAGWYNVNGMYNTATGLLRLNADGTQDSTFVAELPDGTVGVMAVAGQSDGKIVASIARGSAAQTGMPYRVLRLLSTGAADSTFTPIDSTVAWRGIVITAAGKILTSGNGRILRLNTDGSPDSGFQSPAGYADWTLNLTERSDGTLVSQLNDDVVILSANGDVQSRVTGLFPAGEKLRLLATTSDGALFVMHGVPANWHLAWVAETADRTRELDVGLRQRSPGVIQSMAADPASRIIVVGSFNEIDGVPVSHVVRLTPDGKRDATFAFPVDITPGDIALVGADGSFLLSLYDTAPDGTVGYHMRRVLNDGSVDRTLNAPSDITGWFAMTSDHRVLASRFTPDAMHEENFQLLWLTPDGGVERVLSTRFAGLATTVVYPAGKPVTAYTDPLVFAQPVDGGQILVGGQFTSVNGVQQAYVARLNADGSLDATYAPSLPSLEWPNVEAPDIHYRVVVTGTELRDGFPLRRSVRVLSNGVLDATYYNVPMWPSAAQFRQENGVPDLYFPPPNSGSTVSVYGVVNAPDGSRWTRTPLARFVPADVLTVTAQPDGQLKSPGQEAAFYAAIGTREPVSYQWFLNGMPITAGTDAVLTLGHVALTDGGTYTVRVTTAGQFAVSAPITLTVTGGAGRLVNFSTLTNISPARPATVGFVVANDGAPRQWLIRAIGDGLRPFGVTTVLPHPDLTVLGPSGVIAHNYGTAGRTEILDAGGRVGAFAPFLSPYGNMFPEYPDLSLGDSAVLSTLTAGAYAARATTITAESGTVLVEVYDTIAGGASGGLKNASARMAIDATADTLTFGFVVAGPTSIRLLVRGVGPTLRSFGVSSTVPDPNLTLYDAAGRLVATNAGWANNPDIAEAAIRSGAFAFASDSRDAALLANVPAGVYTAQLKSATHATGEAVLEAYVVPQ